MDAAAITCSIKEKLAIGSGPSTRANSPAGSFATSDDADYSATSPVQKSGAEPASTDVEKIGVLGLRRGIRAAILKELGVELNNDDAMLSPTTAGSPHPSQVGHMPMTPSSITSTRPPMLPPSVPTTPVIGDASHRLATPVAAVGDASRRNLVVGDASSRSPMMPSTRLPDASQRTPTMSSPGLPKPGDASRRTPPKPLNSPGLVLGSLPPRPPRADASQRSPVAGPSASSAGAWSSAAATIAATRNAVVLENQNAANTSSAPCVIQSAEPSISQQPPVPAPAHAAPTLHPRPPACPPPSSPSVSSPGRVALHATDSLKCWLSGVSGNTMPSAEELAAQLRAAQPDCYDD